MDEITRLARHGGILLLLCGGTVLTLALAGFFFDLCGAAIVAVPSAASHVARTLVAQRWLVLSSVAFTALLYLAYPIIGAVFRKA